MSKRILSVALTLAIVLSLFGFAGGEGFVVLAAEDSRMYMHGVNLIQTPEGSTAIIFSSNNYPPTRPTGGWVHDFYYSWIDVDNPQNAQYKTLYSAYEAQEPVSAAINKNGVICLTAEDAQYSNLCQTYGIYNSDLSVKVPYGGRLMQPTGGHSGHVAASGDKFLVTFCEEWIDGGGVDGLGTGDDIHARIIDEDGNMGPMIDVSVDRFATPVKDRKRDWWSVVAGSDENWLQIWQRYNSASGSGEYGGTVLGVITNYDNSFSEEFVIMENNKYYYHDVCYIPSIERYLVTGSAVDGGFAVLVDKAGNVISRTTGLPFTVREARTIVKATANGLKGIYPTEATGAAVINITANSVSLDKTLAGSIPWDYMGTDGLFKDDTHVLFATGTKSGIAYETYDLNAPDIWRPEDPNLAVIKDKLYNAAYAPVIAFVGDGVTVGAEGNYTDYLSSLFANINANTVFVNAAADGATATSALAALNDAVIAKKPDLTFVMLGYEDAETGVSAEAFGESYAKIIDTLQAAGSAVILITPNDVISKPASYATIIAKINQLATAASVPVIDLYSQWVILRESLEYAFTNYLDGQGVMPNAEGHKFIFQNMRSALISLIRLVAPVWGDEIRATPGDPPVNVEFYDKYPNVGLNKPIWATSEAPPEDGEYFYATFANDGDYGTRWDSINGRNTPNPQYLWLDLGDVYYIHGVTFDWDSSARNYEIEFSLDGENYTSVYSTTSGGREDAEAVELGGAARWVRFKGNSKNTSSWGYSIIEFGVYGEPAFQNVSVTAWQDNKDAAYTVGFAAGYSNSTNLIEPLMAQHGIKGTTYLNVGSVGSTGMGNWAYYKDLAERGTMALGYFGPNTSGQFLTRTGGWASGMNATSAHTALTNGKQSIATNTGYAAEVMMGNDYYTTGSDQFYTIMGDIFLGTSAGDFRNALNMSDMTDYYNIGAHVVYPGNEDWNNDASDMNAALDNAIAAKGFVSIEAREVYTSGSVRWWGGTPLSWYQTHFSYVDTKKDQIWNDTLGNIIKYMRERDAATVSVAGSQGDSVLVKLSLPESMASELDVLGNPRYDMDLTVKTQVPTEWLAVSVQQGDEAAVEVRSAFEDGASYIVFRATPGEELILLTPVEIGAPAIPVGQIVAEVTRDEITLDRDNQTVLPDSYFELKILNANATLRDPIPAGAVKIANLPAGLSAHVVRVSDTVLRVPVTGKLTAPNSYELKVAITVLKDAVSEWGAVDAKVKTVKIVGGLHEIGESGIAVWKGFKDAAYSAVYDDGIINSLKKFEVLHKKYDLVAEMALCPAFIDNGKHPDDGYYGNVSMGTWDDFRALVNGGYFVPASHMVNHAMKGDSGRDVLEFLQQEGADALEKDFRDSKARLEQELGVLCESLVYPHYDTNSQIAAIASKVYVAARTGDQGMYNKAARSDSFVYGMNDWAIVCKDFLDRPSGASGSDTTVAQATKWLDDVILNGEWLVTTGHGTDYEGWGSPPLSVYDGFLSYVADNKDKIWADTMANITKYRAERNDAVLSCAYDGSTIQIGLTTPNLDNLVYNQSLTIRTRIANDWTQAVVKQDGTVIDAQLTVSGNEKYVVYEALPGAGAIVIKEFDDVTPVDLAVAIADAAQNLVAGYSANIPVTVQGDAQGNELYVALYDGETALTNPVAIAVGEKGVISVFIPTDVSDALRVGVGLVDKAPQFFASITVHRPTGLWEPILIVQGTETTVSFTEDITLKPTAQAIVNGKDAFAVTANPDGKSLTIGSALKDGDVVAISGVKYPILFPSYSFTFTLSYKTPV